MSLLTNFSSGSLPFAYGHFFFVSPLLFVIAVAVIFGASHYKLYRIPLEVWTDYTTAVKVSKLFLDAIEECCRVICTEDVQLLPSLDIVSA